MKNNFLLLLLLATLLTVTYIIHEQGDIKREKAFLDEHQLFNVQKLGEMTSFSNAVMKMTKTPLGDFKSLDQQLLIDPHKLDQALQILAPIQARRFLDDEELEELNLELAFPHSNYVFEFEFEHARVTYLIGEKIQFSQDFYMKISWVEQGEKELSRFVVATDVSPADGVYMEDSFHRSDAKYARLLSLLFLDQDFFADTRLITIPPDINILSIAIENNQNRPFTIDFSNANTLPPAPTGLMYQLEAINSSREILREIQGSRIILNYDPEGLQDQISRIQIELDEMEPITLRLYDSYLGIEGFHATSSNRPGVFPIDSRWSQIFLTHVQSFWNRQVLEHSVELEEMQFANSKVINLNLDREKIVVDLLQSLNSFFRQPADMVAVVEGEHTSFLKVQTLGRSYSFRFNDSDLILTDVERGLEFHFFRIDQNVLPTDYKKWYRTGALSE
jgi:hypothetical protein